MKPGRACGEAQLPMELFTKEAQPRAIAYERDLKVTRIVKSISTYAYRFITANLFSNFDSIVPTVIFNTTLIKMATSSLSILSDQSHHGMPHFSP